MPRAQEREKDREVLSRIFIIIIEGRAPGKGSCQMPPGKSSVILNHRQLRECALDSCEIGKSLKLRRPSFPAKIHFGP